MKSALCWSVFCSSALLVAGCARTAPAVVEPPPLPPPPVPEAVAEAGEHASEAVERGDGSQQAAAAAGDVADATVQTAGAIEPPARPEPTTCTYSTYQWSTVERRGVNRQRIEKAYAEVTDDERSPDDPRCTVCSEDQVTIDPAALGWPGVEPFDACWVYADAISDALVAIADAGVFDLGEVDGYRAGRTRGRLVDGLRTEWSNHSFGTAIDINADFNGLYRSCNVAEVNADTIESCSLGVGGHWRPDRQPEVSVTRDGAVYDAFVDGVGWRWGGEIDGQTRDLMHFSLTGY